MSLNDLNADLLLDIISFLNVQDASRFATTSKRHFYLISNYQMTIGSPEFSMAASWDGTTKKHKTPEEIVREAAIYGLSKPPKLVLAFNTTRSNLEAVLPSHLPKDTIVLGSVTTDIQVNHPATAGNTSSNVECDSRASILCASLSEAAIVKPFSIECESSGCVENEIERLVKELVESNSSNDNHNNNASQWKAFVVYSCGSGSVHVERFVRVLQAAFPQVSIVGGICQFGYVSKKANGINNNVPRHSKENLSRMTIRQLRNHYKALVQGKQALPNHIVEKSELVDYIATIQDDKTDDNSKKAQWSVEHMYDGLYGVALGGAVPVQSMVSRGVRSGLHPNGIPQSWSPWIIHDAIGPNDTNWLFAANHNVHMIRQFRNQETGKIVSAMDMMNIISNSNNQGLFSDFPDFIGIKRLPRETSTETNATQIQQQNQNTETPNGFELHMINISSQMAQSYLIETDGSAEQNESLVNAEVDWFYLNGDACMEDVQRTAERLKQQTANEKILGAIMFSCNGRGPHGGSFISQDMADATQFANAFPNVPCLGFYAGGEIGPLALAGNDQSVFRRGKAAVQGFTVVFMLFIVPVVKNGSRNAYSLEDSTENVNRFVSERLSK